MPWPKPVRPASANIRGLSDPIIPDVIAEPPDDFVAENRKSPKAGTELSGG
jgi:hypothetical protein